MTDPILAPGPRLDPIVSPTGQPVPVTLLTGFLGAGKTTLLNRILNGDHGLRVGVLVNDFGAVNIDAGLISTVEDNTISLSNGCVCCEVRDDLVASLEDLLATDNGIEYVILEASGVADPEGIVMTFLEPRYEDLLRLDGISCVVDADGLFRDRDDEALTMLKLRQIGFADLVLLNKVDLVGPDHVELIRSWIDQHLNRVRIIETEYSDVPLEILLGVGRFDAARAAGHMIDDHTHAAFETWHFATSAALDDKALRKAVKALPASVLRCKGFVHLGRDPTERYALQAVGRRSSLEPIGPWDGAPHTDIIVIGVDGSLDAADLEHRFRGCEVSSVT